MPSDFEYELLHYNDDYGMADEAHNISIESPAYPEGEKGWHFIVSNIEMIVFYPTILIVNLVLLVTICRTEKIRSEPWRWLIAHSSASIIVAALVIFMNRFTMVYGLPSPYTSPLCPMAITLFAILWNVVVVSLVLVALERFRALRLDKTEEGGFSKTTVIVCLSLTWLLVVLVQTIPLAVEPIFFGVEPFVYFDMLPGVRACYATQMVIPTVVRIILFSCAVIAILTVIIGTLVLNSQKFVTPEVKQSLVVPTLSFTVLFFLFALGSECVNVLLLISVIPFNEIVHVFLHLLLLVTWITFPITWLVTWSKNGDISCDRSSLCPCCPGNAEEKRRLLGP